jgi:hypothetical protein
MALIDNILTKISSMINIEPKIATAIADDASGDPIDAGKPSPLRADPTTGALLISTASGGSGGSVTQGAGSGTAAGYWTVRLSDASSFIPLPTALVSGRFDVNAGSWLGSTAPTVGQKTASNSIPVVLASDDTLIAKFTDGTVDNNLGSAVSKTVKSGAGRLLSLSVRHADGSALYLWIFDNTAASGTELVVPILIPATSHVIVGTDFFTTKGLAFSTGLTYGFSTSGSSYSAYGTAANVFATAVYS